MATLLSVLKNGNNCDVAALLLETTLKGKLADDFAVEDLGLPTIADDLTRNDIVRTQTNVIRAAYPPRPKAVRTPKPKEIFENLPTQDPKGRDFLSLEEITSAVPSVTVVETPEAFSDVRSFVQSQTRVGLDFIFSGTFLSTLTFATESQIYVLDVAKIGQPP